MPKPPASSGELISPCCARRTAATAARCCELRPVRGCAPGKEFDVAVEEICGLPTAAGVFLVPGLTNGYRDIELRLEAVEAMAVETRDLVRLLLDHAGIDRDPTPD